MSASGGQAPGSAPAPVRDRRVLLVLALVVAVVLGVNVASALVPGMDGFLAKVPVLAIVLIAGTLGILVRSLARRGRMR